MWIFAPKLFLLALAADPITWQLANKSVKAQSGARISLRVKAEIAEGWHLYSMKEIAGGPKPTRFTVAPPATLSGAIEAPDPLIEQDSNFNAEVEYYTGSAEFAVPIALPKELPARVTVRVRFQSCSEKECLPPKTVELSAAVAPE